MTLATLNDVLLPAVDGNYAVAGLVVLGWEDARAYVEAAEETGLPVILQAGPGCRRHTPVAVLGKMFSHLAEGASVPVVCHIDHARTLDECREGIDHGFTSVMIDGSMLSLAENIKLTAGVVEFAKRYGVSVEGEVGVVGYNGDALSSFSDPHEAAIFSRNTGIDALAISAGNIHLQTTQMAEINLEIVRAIEAITTVPLVLHGGSGIPSTMRHYLSTETRIKKFNIGTELRQAFGSSLRVALKRHPNEFDRIKLLGETAPALKAVAKSILRELAP